MLQIKMTPRIDRCEHVDYGQGVRITAPNLLRERIYHMLYRSQNSYRYNPKVVTVLGGVPTQVFLYPNPGYSVEDAANIAVAVTTIVATAADYGWEMVWLDNGLLIDILIEQGIKGDERVTKEMARAYVTEIAELALTEKLNNAMLAGLNLSQLLEWYDEALECWRNAGTLTQARIATAFDKMTAYRTIALRILSDKLANRQQIMAEIRQLTTNLEGSSKLLPLYKVYVDLLADIEAEKQRLAKELAEFTGWEQIRDEIMDQIRRETKTPAKK